MGVWAAEPLTRPIGSATPTPLPPLQGQLSRLCQALVSGRRATEFSKFLGLERWLVMAAFNMRDGLAHTPAVLADVFEALVGALYLDQVRREERREGSLGEGKGMGRERGAFSHWVGKASQQYACRMCGLELLLGSRCLHKQVSKEGENVEGGVKEKVVEVE